MYLLTALFTTTTMSSLTFLPFLLGIPSHVIGLKTFDPTSLDMAHTVISTGFKTGFNVGEISLSASLPQVPKRGTPTGNTTPGGGTRPEAIEECKSVAPPLTALAENQKRDMTHREHPTFWFYVPYSAKEVTSLEFSFHRSDDLSRLYSASIQLGEQPGIIGVPLPKDAKNALEPGVLYEWRLVAKCGKLPSAQALRVFGYVMYAPLQTDQTRQLNTMTRQQQLAFYREQGYWYDAVSLLAEQMQAQPGDVTLPQEFRNFLQASPDHAAAVAAQPIVGITITAHGDR